MSDLTHEDGRVPLVILRMPANVELMLGVQRIASKVVPGLGKAAVGDVLIQRGDWLCLYEPPEPTP